MALTNYHYIENYSKIGKIGISFDAISEIVKISISDVEKIVIPKEIMCEVKENFLYVNVPIKIHYGTNINEVTSIIQEKIENSLTNMCEINNCKINVKVEGIVVK